GSQALVTYEASSSGDGRAALGSREGTVVNATGSRSAAYRFAGADQAPNQTQRDQIEHGPIDGNGVDVTAADDGKLSVIPIAIGAIAIIVHLPNGCDYTTGATG